MGQFHLSKSENRFEAPLSTRTLRKSSDVYPGVRRNAGIVLIPLIDRSSLDLAQRVQFCSESDFMLRWRGSTADIPLLSPGRDLDLLRQFMW